MEELIKALPKVELHLHLDGSVRVETVLELAKKAGITLPTTDKEELKNHLQIKNECSSLKEYLEKFNLPLKAMQTEEALYRVAYELVEDAAQDDIRYLEVRFAPTLLTDELTKEEVVEAVLGGLKDAEVDYGVQSNLILCCMRHEDPSVSIEVAQLAINYLDKGVVGLDLAGDEAGFPPEEHEQAFSLAKEKGLHRTVHAGEAAGAISVKKAIDYLNAERIGHGIRIKEDTEILEYVKENKIPLEVCPTSNLHTKAVDSLEAYPIKEYYNLGILVTVNTDNRTVSDINLSDEYLTLYNNFDFSLTDITELILNGVKAAFISKNQKEKILQEFKEEFVELIK